MTAVDRPLVDPLILPARTWAPPGRWTYALAAILFLFVVEASSRDSWMPFLLAGIIGQALLGVWLFRLIPTLVHRRLRLTIREWAQWVGLPAVVLATHAAFLSPIPFDFRLTLSRPGMEAAAAEIGTNPEASFGWIGMYPVDRIDHFDGGFRFLIWGSGFLDPLGFAYATNGDPPVVGEDRYTPLDGGWWHWTESW